MADDKVSASVIKIGLLGDSTVGKTAICNSFMNIEFNPDTLTTIGHDKLEKKYKFQDGKEMKVIILDTAGQERFKAIATKTLKAVLGVIVVFDVTIRKTFENVNEWLEKIKEDLSDPNIVIFGNKIDKEGREISPEEAEKFAKSLNLKYFETSAKLSQGINEGFDYIINESYKKIKGGDKPNILIDNGKIAKKKEKTGCFGKKKK